MCRFFGAANRPCLRLFLGILILPALSLESFSYLDNESPGTIFLSVYPSVNQVSGSRAGLVAIASETELSIKSASPLTNPRPLLLLVDPNSYGRVEMRRRVSGVARAWAAMSEARGRSIKVRIGIPVLDGILGAWLTDPRTLAQELDKTLDSYFPEKGDGELTNPGRTIDLIAALLRKTQEDGGPVDGLLIARDRRYSGDEAGYFVTSVRRQILDVCLTRGSTLYGFLAGPGLFQEVSLSTGGIVFPDNLPPEQVANRILEEQERGYLLSVVKPESLPTGMRSKLSFTFRSKGERQPELRGPTVLWVHPAGKPVPDQYHVRQALDWVRRAREADEDLNFASALRFIDSSLQEDSWNTQAFYLGGKTAFALGDMPLAGSYLEQALQLGATEEPVLLLYGKVYEKTGRAQTALARYRTVMKGLREPSPSIRLQMAKLLSSSGGHEEAGAIYAELLARGNGDAVSHAEYGRVLWQLGKSEDARKEFEAALAMNPNSTEALIYASEAAFARGNLSQAVELGSRAVQSRPRDADVQAHMGKIEGAQKNWRDASGYYRTAAALAPNRRDLVDALVEVLVNDGNESEAKEILNRMIENDAGDVSAYRSLARIQARSGEISDAVSTLERGAAQSSQEAHILYREAAELRERRGEYGQALLDYRAMLRSAPPEVASSDKRDLAHHLSFLSRLLSSSKSLLGIAGEKKAEAAVTSPPQGRAENSKTDAAAERLNAAGLVVPGGLDLLGRTLGIDPALLREQDAVERIFSYMLELAPINSDRLQDNPIRRDVVAYLRHYDDLIAFMRKRALLPANFDPIKGHDFRFSLLAGGEEQKKTRRFLSFFGVGFKSEQTQDGNYRVELNLKQNRGAAERQQFLRNLGVNILDKNLREFRFSIRDEELPILFDSRIWVETILNNEKSKSQYLLGKLVLNSRAMRLYIALAGCAVSTRDALMKVAAPGELLTVVDAVAMHGRYLEFRDGTLVFPGSQEAWEKLTGAPANDPARFVPALLHKDQGRALLLYYALTIAPKSVQQVLTSSAERLNELYQILPASYAARARSGGGAGRHDLGRILRQFSADEKGLKVEVDRRFEKYLVGSQDGAANGEGAGSVRLAPRSLQRFVSQENDARAGTRDSIVDTLEFVRFLQSSYPEMLQDTAIDALMRDPFQSPLFLDLVWDLRLPADLLVKYLQYCREMARLGDRGWNVNRTRTSQALLHLLSILHRQGSLKREEALRLFGGALDRLAAEDESTFAQQVAEFIATQLLPALDASLPKPDGSADRLLQALAGPDGIQEFAFDGKQLSFDPAQYKLRRMKGAIQQQRYTSLIVLLRAYELLRLLKEGREGTASALQELRRTLAEVRSAEFKPETPASARQAVATIDSPSLSAKLESAQRSSKGSSSLAQLASAIGASLHTELGVTLLTYCYAYQGAAETDALAFDSNFVRKHQFYDSSFPKDGGWNPARLEQKEWIGSYVAGSISGLGFELCNLETAQSVQSFGRREGKSLVPTILTGIRSMRRSLRSDRAQEYVALSVRLGREILALSGISNAVNRWCGEFLGSLVPPKRRERTMRLINEGNAGQAAEILSPSELFLMGTTYLNSSDSLSAPIKAEASWSLMASDLPATQSVSAVLDPALAGSGGNGGDADSVDEAAELDCPVMKRLRQVVPEASSREADVFKQEVHQYGILLRKRLGLNQLSLSISDSYEQLEIGAREEVLFERLCDLKIRLAEIGHALGIPASLGEVVGELAIRDILPRSASIRTNSWKLVLEQIGRLENENARNWIEELLNRGIVTVSTKGTGEK